MLTKKSWPLDESEPKILVILPLVSLPKKAELTFGWLITVDSLDAILKPPLKLAIVLLEVAVMVVVVPVELEVAFPATTVIPEGFAPALSVRPKNKMLVTNKILFLRLKKDIGSFLGQILLIFQHLQFWVIVRSIAHFFTLSSRFFIFLEFLKRDRKLQPLMHTFPVGRSGLHRPCNLITGIKIF